MAAFFVLSGITNRSEEITFKKFLKKKLKTLCFPYLVFALIMLAYLLAKRIVFHGYTFDIISGLVSIVVPVSGRVSTTVYGLWFFPCLFLAEIIFYVLLYVKKMRSCFLSVLCYMLLCTICWGIHLWSNVISIMDILPIAVFYLGIGGIIKKKLVIFEEKHVCIGISSFIMFSMCVFCNYQFSRHVFDLSSMTLGIWPLYILSGIFGSALVYSLAISISKSRLLGQVGRDSMYYYGLHYEVLGVVEKNLGGGVLQTAVTMSILYLIIFFYKRIKILFI